MARGRTPLITIVMPAVEDCNDEEIGKEILEMSYGNKKLNFDIIHVPVTITARDKSSGKVVLERKYEPEDWDCLESFLDDFRRGLDIDISTELVENLKSQVATLIKQSRSARADADHWAAEARFCTKEIRLLSKRSVDVERLGTIVDLERRTRARREMEQLAGIRLHRWSHPSLKRIIEEARKLI